MEYCTPRPIQDSARPVDPEQLSTGSSASVAVHGSAPCDWPELAMTPALRTRPDGSYYLFSKFNYEYCFSSSTLAGDVQTDKWRYKAYVLFLAAW